jgi:Fic family protein
MIRAGCPDIASHILSNFYNETRNEYYRQLQRANDERDLTCFIEYALQGLRDGLRSTLAAVQQSQFRIAWRKLVYDTFAERPITNRNTFNRQRALMLVMPNEPVSFAEITRLTPALEALYDGLNPRTTKRDIEALERMGLIVREGDTWRAKAELLGAHIPQRRNNVPARNAA